MDLEKLKKRSEKPIYELSDDELHELLDKEWYPNARDARENQAKIWDFSYLAYKGIILWSEINRKRRKNNYGLYVNVPRTFMTIEGIRKNFNINRLLIDIERMANMSNEKAYKIKNFLNYDLDRSGTRAQIKDAGFNKLLYGNGFLYTYLLNKQNKYGTIVGDVDPKTGRVKINTDKKNQTKYYGMVARSVSPYNIFPDKDGSTLDVDDNINRLCNYVCIRTVKQYNNFIRDWKGIIPDEILNEVQPGGDDLTNYEAVKETIDYLFDYNSLRYPGTVQDFVSSKNIQKQYSSSDYVEERIWVGEDFLIVQAGKGLKLCLISCNPNPEKRYAIIKLDDVSVPGEFWSMGEPYLIRYQQIEENRLHNSILDLIGFSVSGMAGININYLEDPDDLEMYPGKIWKFKAIPGTSVGDIMQNFQPSPAAISPAMRFMQEVKATGQSTTSITDFVTGASKSIADTATEASKLSSASEITILDKTREMVSGALINVCKNWYAQYPIVYEGEKIELSGNGSNLYFVGKTKEETSEEELTELLKTYEAEDIIFLDDLDVTNPKFKIVGDIEISKDYKLRQWISAIDMGRNVNDMAYATGDSRRIDVVKMGLEAISLFEVVTDPQEYLIKEQPTKIDELVVNAQANQANNGGRPTESTKPAMTNNQAMRSEAQPK